MSDVVSDYDFQRWLEEDLNDDAGPRLFAFVVGSFSGAATAVLAEHLVWPAVVWAARALWP